MVVKNKKDREQYELFNIEDLVPAEHLLRKIENAIDFDKIYEFCEDNGRPSIDPVILFKMVIIQHIYGIPSLRKTEEVKMNIAYRWFLGYLMNEQTPRFRISIR